jgi:O-acetylserine/cysteine efflux transporter
MTQQHIRFGALDVGVAVVMNIMWGLNLIVVKVAVDLIEPLTAAMLRQIIVLLVCLPALKLIPGKMRELVALGLLSGMLFYVVVNVSLAVSTNISAIAIAGQLGAPFSLILAVIFLGERIAKYRIAGMTLSFFGVVILVFDPAAVNELPGLLLTALASLIWAICSLIQRRLVGVPVFSIYAWIGLIGSVSLAPIAWYFEPTAFSGVPNLPVSAIGWVAFSAIGSTVIGQGAMSWLIQRHPVSVVVPLTLPTPVISVIVATLYFKTPMTPVMILGGTIVMIGVAIVTIRTAKVGQQRA